MAEFKNVLSIDLDYIMAPCIQLYNNYVGDIMNALESEYGKEESGYYGSHLEEFWKWMNDDLYCERFYMFDNTKFEQVSNLLYSKVEDISDKDIYFAKEHDAILTFLCNDEDKKDYTFNVYNIDHHHDIFYAEEAREKIEKYACSGLADWVYYLYDFGKLKHYYWISNEESKYPLMKTEDYSEFNTIHDIQNILDLDKIHFDYIFVCKSEYYVPLKYHFLFDTMKENVEKIKSTKFLVDNDSYCNERTRFPVGW